VTSFTPSWLPASGAVRGIGRALDETASERGIWGNGVEYWKRAAERMGQKTEVLDAALPDLPKRDLWGRPVQKTKVGGPLTSFLYRALMPIEIRENGATAADAVIVDYNNLHPDDQKWPMPPGKRVKVSGEERSLTDEEYDRYVKDSGQLAAAVLRGWKFDPLGRHTDADFESIDKARHMALDHARHYLSQGSPEDYEKDAQEIRTKIETEMAEKLARAKPPLKKNLDSWNKNQAESMAFFTARNLDESEVKKEYWKYLVKEYKGDDARDARMARFSAKLPKKVK
jgi:hypothetical protein